MCHFITLIAPTDDAALVHSVMERHGRIAKPTDNPSVRKALDEGERQYLTTSGQCDCGTVLAPRVDTSGTSEDNLDKMVARMRRKGWSESKITRASDGRRKAEVRPHRGSPDSIELWNTVLNDLSRDLKLPHLGLLIRFYAGAVDTERFSVSRREVAAKTPWREALASVMHDELTIFRPN